MSNMRKARSRQAGFDVMTSDALRDSRLGLRAVLFLLAAGLLTYHALFFNFLNDDAFISFRYADNLARHGQLVFNLGERVEGYTNFLWTVLMAGVIWLGQDPGLWSRVLGIGFAIGTLWVVMSFLAHTRGRRSYFDPIGAFLLAGAPAYACWSTGGLETQLFTFMLTLGLTGYLRARSGVPEALPRSGIWFALAAMTRPEGMLVLGLVAIHHYLEMLILEKRWIPNRTEWVWAAMFLAFFVPFFAWRWAYYGWPFPNTYYVKTGASGFWSPGGRYLWSWVSTHGLWLFPILAFFAYRSLAASRRRLLTLSLLVIVVHILHVTRVGGDFMALHRFFVPIMPMMAIVATLGLADIITRYGVQHRWIAVIIFSLGMGLATTHVIRIDQHAMTDGSDQGVDRIGWLKKFHGQCEAIGKWLGENAPTDASLATTAAGIIPYYSRLYTVDILGLNDEWVAHNVPARGHRPGHTKSAPLSYILKKNVDYLIYHPTISENKPGRSASEKQVWRKRGYTWSAIKIPGLAPNWWGFWQTTDRLK
jgi:arabinofuranosyltransferase